MSLIQQALDKAQTAYQEAPASEVVRDEFFSPLPLPEKPVAQKKMPRVKVKKKTFSPVWGIFLGSVVIALLVGFIFFKPVLSFLRSLRGPVQSAMIFPASSIPSLRSITEPRYKLSGITTAGNEKLAVIDDKVLALGESLSEGVKVLEIQEKAVVLDSRGSRITLKL